MKNNYCLIYWNFIILEGGEMKKINLDKAFWFVGTILTIFAFQLKLDFASDGTVVSFAKSFREYSITCIFLVPVLFLFYQFVSQTNGLKKDKNKFFCLLPALLFSFFMVMGYSYEKINSWNLVINSSNFQWLKALIAFSGYTIFFYYCISFMFYKIDSSNLFLGTQSKQIKIIEKYFKYLKQRPFVTSFITLLILYIPYIIASYPAIFMGDTPIQIVQAYPECGQFAPYYTKNFVLEEGNYLNNHHPIIHTLLIHGFIQGGSNFFSSYNAGIFMYALLQLVFMLVAVAYLISFLIEIGVSEKWVCLVLFYYFCSYKIQNYMFLVNKDVIFSAFVLIFIVSMIRIFLTGKRRYYLLFGISVLGIILFRNDGRYMLIVSFIIIGILNQQFRKRLLACAVLVSLFSVVYSNIVLPAFHIMPGSTREMLSVPFQQTARYLRESSTPVTQKEKDAIAAVLDYDIIIEKYNPELADPVKATFNEMADSDELKEYFKVYLSLFFKHPSHYIQATMNNYNCYYYPSSRLFHYTYTGSRKAMDDANKKCEVLGMDFAHPKILDKYRNKYEAVMEGIARLPVIATLISPATYSWCLILVVFYCIKSKNKKAMAVTVPLCVQLLICMVGPTNGLNFRYIFSIALCMPVVIILCLYFIKKKKVI